MNAKQRRITDRKNKASHPFRDATHVRVTRELQRWSGSSFPKTWGVDGNDKPVKVGMLLEIQSKKWVRNLGDYALTFKDIYTFNSCDEVVPLTMFAVVQERDAV